MIELQGQLTATLKGWSALSRAGEEPGSHRMR